MIPTFLPKHISQTLQFTERELGSATGNERGRAGLEANESYPGRHLLTGAVTEQEVLVSSQNSISGELGVQHVQVCLHK